jgi:predicted NAD/FAD-binding protein
MRVLVVGGGAAGTAAAWTLSRTPGFDVTLMEKEPALGGVAFSRTVSLPYGMTEINVGVQGAHPSYANTLAFHKVLGFTHRHVRMTTSFGHAEDRWTNTDAAAAPILVKHKREIARFGGTLRFINTFRAVFTFISIKSLLHFFGYSASFGADVVFPLVALFFGTGNQTANTSAALVARVFLDPDFKLFEYDEERFANGPPDMIAFDPLSRVFEAARQLLVKNGVNVKLQTALMRVDRGLNGRDDIIATDSRGRTYKFDKVIFACPAEVAKRLLGADADAVEKRVLGSVKYYDDLTVTHFDREYSRSHFDTADFSYAIRHARSEDPAKFEMFFNLSLYQGVHADVFQTIFLDEKEKNTWSLRDIDANKILLRNSWRQFAHTTQHYADVVAHVKGLNRSRADTVFCGSWVLANTHEMATVSGICAAVKIGAEYPFEEDARARKIFQKIQRLCF